MSGDGTVPRRTVLVAEDDPDLLMLVERRLSRAGYTVIAARDGQEALDLITELSPHVAVLDVMMPFHTGIEVLERIRADPATAALPVILMSAGFTGDRTQSGVPVGANDFVSKPFNPGELRARIDALFDNGAAPDR